MSLRICKEFKCFFSLKLVRDKRALVAKYDIDNNPTYRIKFILKPGIGSCKRIFSVLDLNGKGRKSVQRTNTARRNVESERCASEIDEKHDEVSVQ